MNDSTYTGPLFIGWDVGGWNCDRNASSRVALVVLDSERNISLRSEWVPSLGYGAIAGASRGISHYLMTYYNWERPHQHNDGLPPGKA